MGKAKIQFAKPADRQTVTQLMREYFAYDGIRWNRHVESGIKKLGFEAHDRVPLSKWIGK